MLKNDSDLIYGFLISSFSAIESLNSGGGVVHAGGSELRQGPSDLDNPCDREDGVDQLSSPQDK